MSGIGKHQGAIGDTTHNAIINNTPFLNIGLG
jgi:hypothetical protein